MSSLPNTTSAKIKPWMIYACGALSVGLLVGWGACWLIRHQPAASHEIDWSSYAALWGAFATAFTGLAAVGGAFYIGQRQLGIQQAQTNIQLLERRAEAIKSISTFYRAHLAAPQAATEQEWGGDQRCALFNKVSIHKNYIQRNCNCY